ncbi:helix-turn-helix domain-containing protein [Plantactinospora sp. CA-290183]|uniref:helix-turn-helix domain-containing protein n=1 Tax=Plantactinospora sp. CA-290183 TaxID=3240006 RepID=UPI003D8A7A3F
MSSSLAMALRHLRSAKGLTQEQAAEAIRVSASLIAAFETDRRIPLPDTAQRLDQLFGSGNLVATMAAEARRGAAPEWFRPFGDYEREAVALRTFEPLYVPGLLQTEAYARAVLAGGLLDAEQAEARLAIRLDRQATILDGPRPPLATFVVDEAALLRGDPEIMREQVAHLIELSHRPRVFLHLVPFSAGVYVGQSGAFALVTLEDGADVAFMEDQLTGRLIPEPEPLAILVRAWDGVRSVALPRDLTRAALSKMVDRHDP